MRLITRRAWLLVVVSAILQVFCFPTGGPMPAWRGALCWIALVPLLLALLGPDRDGNMLRTRDGAALGYVCGIVWYMGNCSWIYQTMFKYGGLSKPISFGILILFSLYLGLYHALFGAAVVYLRRAFPDVSSRQPGSGGSSRSRSGSPRSGRSGSHQASASRRSNAGAPAGFAPPRKRRRRSSRPKTGLRNALIMAPCLWTALELARARITGFPWDLLGNSQVDNRFFTQLAPLAGVMAMSFVIVGVNAGLTSWMFFKGRQKYLPAIVSVAVALFLQVNETVPIPEGAAQPSQLAVLMQENLEVGAAGRGQRKLGPEQELATFTEDSLHPAHRILDSTGTHRWSTEQTSLHPTVIVWPEAPSHLQSNDPAFRLRVGEMARTAEAPVIAGSLGVDFNKSADRGYYLYDSASLFDSAGNYTGRYDKIHLVPWGEYVPFKEFFAFAKKLTEGVGDMDRGMRRDVFSTGGHQYGVFVCYESIFGDEVRHFVLNGAQVLVNISDDGWYGDSGAPWQHLNMARMRAIENNRWLVRATNTGVTTAIDPHGVMAYEAPRHLRGAFAFPFEFTSGLTWYTQYGDWFAWVCVFLSAAALGLSTQRPGSAAPRSGSELK
jgi:apolipoprotein N-acyltransferase